MQTQQSSLYFHLILNLIHDYKGPDKQQRLFAERDGVFSFDTNVCSICLPSHHILNAQVAIRSPCCRKWFDCVECHHEQENHELLQSLEMIFACKKCKKCFRKDVSEFEESDEYCPHCDNHFVIDAVTPKPALKVEGEDVRVDSRMLKDDRQRQEEERSIFNVKEAPNKLG